MPRKINIITTGFNEEFTREFSANQYLTKAMDMLDAFSDLKPDLICLPETFTETGSLGCKCTKDTVDVTFKTLSEKAVKLKSYIVAGTHEFIGQHKYNSAWLIDREGKLAGRYMKNHPVDYEIIKNKVTPGSDIPVFKTDFGTIGIAICFDIGWPEVWSTLASKGAELVTWISAYDGGFPLRSYANQHSYYVVSSVWTNHAKIIDKTSMILAETSRWTGWTSRTIDLEKEIFHTDYQNDKLLDIQCKLGSKVSIESFSQENIFTLESNDDEWPVEKIIKEFNLVTFREYYKKSEALQNEAKMNR